MHQLQIFPVVNDVKILQIFSRALFSLTRAKQTNKQTNVDERAIIRNPILFFSKFRVSRSVESRYG